MEALQEVTIPIPAGKQVLTWKAYCEVGAVIVLADFRYGPWALAFSVEGARYSTARGFQGTLQGNSTNAAFRLEWSEDLKNWTPWLTVSNFQNAITISDPGATNRSRSFYRAVK